MGRLSTFRDWCANCSAYTEQFPRELESPARTVQVCAGCDRTTCDPARVPLP